MCSPNTGIDGSFAPSRNGVLQPEVNGKRSVDWSELGEAPSPTIDPWALPELQDEGVKWSERTVSDRRRQTCIVVSKIVGLVLLLYFFVCSLDLLSSAFRLLGGRTAGYVFKDNEQLRNPVTGLMIGILATVLVQSSSTSSSIVVTMVASEILDVPTAIPIIMGANVGTSITNTFVSFAQASDRNEFRRAFAAATVHDMFNWLTVAVLLSLEVTTGYLYHLSTAIVDSINWETKKSANTELLTVLTKPLTSVIVQLDKKVIESIALGDDSYANHSLIKRWCNPKVATGFASENVTRTFTKCRALFSHLELEDTTVGLILLLLSLFILCMCLILMVKILNSMLRGRVAVMIKKTLNADLPGRLAFLTGYLAILVGCGLTILVQSSSIFTSTLTPLVGIGVISLERMYPLTLGSNIGTTTTGLLASLTATGVQLRSSVQIALCHLLFNVTGILLFYPVPFMRWPISLARTLGDTTAKYRWFAVFYLLAAFLLLPAFVFVLSACGRVVFLIVIVPVGLTIAAIVAINVAQAYYRSKLPVGLRDWSFLPTWMRSLEPLDRVVVVARDGCKQWCCCCCRTDSYGDYSTGNIGGGRHGPTKDGFGRVTSRAALIMHVPSTASFTTDYVFDNQHIEMNVIPPSGKC